MPLSERGKQVNKAENSKLGIRPCVSCPPKPTDSHADSLASALVKQSDHISSLLHDAQLDVQKMT